MPDGDKKMGVGSRKKCAEKWMKVQVAGGFVSEAMTLK
jgi:hypothetical protein